VRHIAARAGHGSGSPSQRRPRQIRRRDPAIFEDYLVRSPLAALYHCSGTQSGKAACAISHKGTRLHRNGVLECSPASHLLNVCLWRCTMSTYGLQIVQMGGRKLKHRGGVWDGLQSNSTLYATLYVCFNLQRNVKCPWMQKNLSKAYRRFSAAQQCSLHAPQVFMRHAVQRDPSGAPTGVRQH